MGNGARAEEDSRARRVVRLVGLVAGPLLALACRAALPAEYVGTEGDAHPFTAEGRTVLAVLVWMACWWMTEAVAIQATALLPVVLFPLLGVASMGEATAPYASPLIFLFLGGFLLAMGMQRWGLDRRIALLTLRRAGPRPRRMIGGFMVATAMLSSCVSNTATVAMMLAVGMSVIELLRREGGADGDFPLVLMLGIAYAASIGGLGTVIGSPPNGFLVQFAADHLDRRITFLDWLAIGLPLVVVLLPTTWFLLTRVLHRVEDREVEGGREMLEREVSALGPMKRGERATFVVFVLAVLAWVLRPVIERWLAPGLTDAGVAMTAGVLLFAVPVHPRRGEFVLDWRATAKLPWGVLVLFGGGLSLAWAVGEHGVAEFLGSQARYAEGMAPFAMLLLVVAGMVLLTELTSNTATAATLIPILTALAPGLGVEAMFLIVPATLAASCAFMLPVATPPNAIVFASGAVTIPQMCRAGLWLNLLAVGVICAFGVLV